MSILVIGAGELGSVILHALATHPKRSSSTPISVLLRTGTINTTDPDKRQLLSTLQSQDINFVPGDIGTDDAATLTKVFKPFHTIVGAAGLVLDSGTQLKVAHAVIAAAEAPDGKIKRYIPWQFGLDYDVIGRGSAQQLFTEQLDVRDVLRAAAKRGSLEWVIVSTGIFTSILFESAFGVVDVVGADGEVASKAVVRAMGTWDNKVTYTTPRDIGRLTAEVVLAAPEVKNEVVFIAGETASFEQVKDAVQKALKREVSGELCTLEALKEDLAADPDNGYLKYRIVLAEGVGVAWDKDKTFNAQRGIDTQSVEEYAVERIGHLS